MKCTFKRLALLTATIVSATTLLSGCSGSDGASGVNGADGATGPAGPVSLAQESCVVCHSTNDVADQVAMHTYVYDAATGTRTLKPKYLESAISVTDMTLSQQAETDKPVVTFKVSGLSDNTKVVENDVRVYIADIVPAGTDTDKGTFVSPYPEMWGYVTGGIKNLVGTDVSGTLTYDATSKVFTYVFPTAFFVATQTSSTNSTTGVVTTNNYRAVNYDADHPQRVFVRVAPTVASLAKTIVDKNYGYEVADYTLNGVGALATKAIPQHQTVTIEACKSCHGEPLVAAAHGGSYRDMTACVMCHSPLYYNEEAAVINSSKFYHEIHAAKDLAEFPTRIFGAGYKDVTYPRPLTDCTACHTNSGRTTLVGTSADETNNWKTKPSAEACLSCHDAEAGAHYVGIPSAGCVICHTSTQITAAHTETPATKDVPEYVATMTVSAPASGTFYVAGETPTVTVTLKDKSGAAAPGAVYTAASHTAGAFNANALSKSQIYVYGPRTTPMPVLTLASRTLSAAGIPTQAQKLFVNAADTQILSDATGFKYKLDAIPADMKAGTYMVRYTGANYSYKSATDYKIDTTAFQTIQIGTATAEKKIAGDTTVNCTNCHGTGLLEAHNARHSVVFNTDECISCHDKSGNHADRLENRVHAIHAASVAGDALGKDWSAVTYPQGMRSATVGVTAGAPRCIGCHTNTAATAPWKASISANSCTGCHADKASVVNGHFASNGGEAVAAH